MRAFLGFCNLCELREQTGERPSPDSGDSGAGAKYLYEVFRGGLIELPLALSRYLRRLLARARRSDADVHLLLFAARSDDDRHAGRVINPVPACEGHPSAARAGAVVD
jgi:hypothetical protein